MHIKYALLLITFLIIPAVAQDGTEGRVLSEEERKERKELIEQLAEAFATYRADMFQLGQPCGEKIGLLVEDLTEDAKDIGLTEKSIETTVRSRLRSAKIYDDIQSSLDKPFLFVNASVFSLAFHVRIELNQPLTKPAITNPDTEQEVSPEITRYAPTWQTASLGTHGSNAGYILQAIATSTDEFIDEYLRVNETICEASK